MPRVLLVDDDPGMLRALELVLAGTGYEISTAQGGEQGLRLFGVKAPDVVVTDLMMPGKDGLEIIMEMRRGGADIGIVAMSGYGDPEKHSLLAMAAALGANCVIAKPFGRDQLIAAIEKALRWNRPQTGTTTPDASR